MIQEARKLGEDQCLVVCIKDLQILDQFGDLGRGDRRSTFVHIDKLGRVDWQGKQGSHGDGVSALRTGKVSVQPFFDAAAAVGVSTVGDPGMQEWSGIANGALLVITNKTAELLDEGFLLFWRDRSDSDGIGAGVCRGLPELVEEGLWDQVARETELSHSGEQRKDVGGRRALTLKGFLESDPAGRHDLVVKQASIFVQLHRHLEELDRRKIDQVISRRFFRVLCTAKKDLAYEGLEELAGNGLAVTERSKQESSEVIDLVQRLTELDTREQGAQVRRRVDDRCSGADPSTFGLQSDKRLGHLGLGILQDMPFVGDDAPPFRREQGTQRRLGLLALRGDGWIREIGSNGLVGSDDHVVLLESGGRNAFAAAMISVARELARRDVISDLLLPVADH